MTSKTEKMTPEQQRAAFEATARELGCDESPDAFEAAVKKVARHKPVEEKFAAEKSKNRIDRSP